jgi:hypothetical protein
MLLLVRRRFSRPTRPTAVFFVTSRSLLAAAVEQGLAHILPNRVRSIKPDRIEALDLDVAKTPQALDAKNLASRIFTLLASIPDAREPW